MEEADSPVYLHLDYRAGVELGDAKAPSLLTTVVVDERDVDTTEADGVALCAFLASRRVLSLEFFTGHLQHSPLFQAIVRRGVGSQLSRFRLWCETSWTAGLAVFLASHVGLIAVDIGCYGRACRGLALALARVRTRTARPVHAVRELYLRSESANFFTGGIGSLCEMINLHQATLNKLVLVPLPNKALCDVFQVLHCARVLTRLEICSGMHFDPRFANLLPNRF